MWWPPGTCLAKLTPHGRGWGISWAGQGRAGRAQGASGEQQAGPGGAGLPSTSPRRGLLEWETRPPAGHHSLEADPRVKERICVQRTGVDRQGTPGPQEGAREPGGRWPEGLVGSGWVSQLPHFPLSLPSHQL